MNEQLKSQHIVALQDYQAALAVYNMLLDKDIARRAQLLTGISRIHLQVLYGLQSFIYYCIFVRYMAWIFYNSSYLSSLAYQKL